MRIESPTVCVLGPYSVRQNILITSPRIWTMQHQHLSTYNPLFSEHILGNSFNKHWKWRKINKTAVNLALHMSNESWISYTVLFFIIRTEDFAEIQDILSNDIHGILARIYLREATSYRWHISITIRDTVTLILHCYILQTKEGKACGFKGIMDWIISNFLRKELKNINLLLSVEEEEFL